MTSTPHRASSYSDPTLVSDYSPPKYDPFSERDEPFVPPKDGSGFPVADRSSLIHDDTPTNAGILRPVRSPSPNSVYSSGTIGVNRNNSIGGQKSNLGEPTSIRAAPLHNIDEEYNPYQARDPKTMGMGMYDDDRDSLMHNAAAMGGIDKSKGREDLGACCLSCIYGLCLHFKL
jgi:hypothetical protein